MKKQLASSDHATLAARIATRKREAEELGGYAWWSDGRGIREADGEGGFEVLIPIQHRIIGFVLQADPMTIIAQCVADQMLLEQLLNHGVETELFDAVLESFWARYPITAEELMAARG